VFCGDLSCGQKLYRIKHQNDSGYTNPISWIVLEGLEVASASVDGIKGYNAENIIIRNCNIHHSAEQGILMVGSNTVLFDGNQVHENGDSSGGRNQDHGIYAAGRHWTVTNNIFYGNAAYGIQLAAYYSANSSVRDDERDGHIDDWTIANNVITYQRNRTGIVVWDGGNGGSGGNCTNVHIFNNIFFHNGEDTGSITGVRLYKDGSGGVHKNITINNNLYVGTGPFISNYANASYTESNNVNLDPLFINTDRAAYVNNNFHLQSDSPAIDAGISTDAPADDFDGNPRPQGAGFDIGVYEYLSGVSSTPTPAVASLGADAVINGDDLTAWMKSYSSINKIVIVKER
jgi:hypothetical protein